jgi:hypothetical protein
MELAHRYDRMWERLLLLLDTLGEVDATTPGRLRLRAEGHDIEIVMAERDWEDMAGTVHGSFVSAAAEVLLAIKRAQMNGAPFLVFDTYELHPSATARSPVQAERDADRQRIEEYLLTHPGARFQARAHSPDPDETS